MIGIVLQVFAHRRNRLFLLLLILFPMAAMYAQDPTPDELVKAANAASDLEKAGSYRMDGTVVVYSGRKQIATGQVTIGRDGNKSREEMSLRDYHEVDVSVGDTLYVWHKPLVASSVASKLRTLEQLWQIPPAGVSDVLKRIQVHSTPALCIKANLDKKISRISCFDPETKLLTSFVLKGPFETTEVIFSGYSTFAGEHFPRHLTYIQNGALQFELRDINVTKAEFAEDYFTLPGDASDALEFRSCRITQPPILVHSIHPVYPALAYMAHIRGEVVLAAVIGEDGKLKNLQVVSGHPFLAAAALDAVRQWRYVPAMCPFRASRNGNAT